MPKHETPGIGVLDARYVNVSGDTMTGDLTINTNSTTALLVEQDGVKDNVLVVDTTNNGIGLGTTPSSTIGFYLYRSGLTNYEGMQVDLLLMNPGTDAMAEGLFFQIGQTSASPNAGVIMSGIRALVSGKGLAGGFENLAQVFGIRGTADQTATSSATRAYGGKFAASVASSDGIAYGLYSSVSGSGTLYSGYFTGGDLYLQSTKNLTDGTNSLTIAQAKTAYDFSQDATLISISALGTAADKMLYTTAVDTWAEASLTAAGRALLDDATAAAQLTTLGAANNTLSNLGTVAVNTTIASDTDSTDDLGSSTKFWENAYVDKIFLNATATLDGATAGKVNVVGVLVTDNNFLQPASAYHNFGTTEGSSGYGIRDNAGTIEIKNSGGSWTAPGKNTEVHWVFSLYDNIYTP